MMFINFGEKHCPLCGVKGTGFVEGALSCPVCGAVFNTFGVILAEESSDGFFWN